jgi:hypothetical protein
LEVVKMPDGWEKKRALATKVRRAVFARAGGRCELRLDGCTGTAEEVDHIIPRAAGGPMFDLTNLRAVCRNCHKQRPSAARFRKVGDPCATYSHVVGDAVCPRCGRTGPSRNWYA